LPVPAKVLPIMTGGRLTCVANFNNFAVINLFSLTLSNPIFLPTAYSPALIYFGRERGWWITCNYRTVLKKKT
jgi:hypothetical protein